MLQYHSHHAQLDFGGTVATGGQHGAGEVAVLCPDEKALCPGVPRTAMVRGHPGWVLHSDKLV
jgi:hypothetical protein